MDAAESKRIEAAIRDAYAYCDLPAAKTAEYRCCGCGTYFEPAAFGLLPVINGKLYCNECYEALVKTTGWRSGGRLGRLLEDRRVDGYAFSHSGTSVITFTARNARDGRMRIVQEMTDIGCGFYVNGSRKMIHGVFHPFLIYFQRNDCEFPH